MKITFSSIEKGDNLYIVYKDLNDDYQIGKAIVTGFHDWSYDVGDRFETYVTRTVKNIDYKFENIAFSRNLEYCLDDTHFKDHVESIIDHTKLFNCRSVDTFTTYDEARNYIIQELIDFININQTKIKDIESKIEKYKNNIQTINKET